MLAFVQDDVEFCLHRTGEGWGVTRTNADGSQAWLGTGLFPGLPLEEARSRAHLLVKTIRPVGVRCVAPDVAHAVRIGDLRIVPPDVNHSIFIPWTVPGAAPGRENGSRHQSGPRT